MTEPKYISDVTFVYDKCDEWKAVYAGNRLLDIAWGWEELDAGQILDRLGFDVKYVTTKGDYIEPPELLEDLNAEVWK